jgi:integrase
MTGHIRRRGKKSWELKFDAGMDPATGKRKTRFASFKGTKRDAEIKLANLIAEASKGESVDPSKITVAEYVRGWLDSADVAPKTLERYKQLAEQQIIPHLGATLLQKLRPAQVQAWHGILTRAGGKGGKPLAARTVGHAHRVLHTALARATAAEVVSRNVASVISPPKVEGEEIEILGPTEITDVLAKLVGDDFFLPLVTIDLGTGMRRGELLALKWPDVDFDGASVRVERSVEETKAGLRLKTTKTKYGRRTISLPQSAVEALRAHRRKQLEIRMALGLGRDDAETLVFGTAEGGLLSPDNLSRDWGRLVKRRRLPDVSFHALRHTHASVLIASGLDVVKVSRRLGHSSPVVTLTVYAHLFEKTDTAAAAAIEAALTR